MGPLVTHSLHASLPVPGADVFQCLYVTPRGLAAARGSHYPHCHQHPAATLCCRWHWSLPWRGRGACEPGARGPAATMTVLSWKAHLGQNPLVLAGLTLCSHSLGWECTIRIEGHYQTLCQNAREAQTSFHPPTWRLSPISSQKSWWIFNKCEGLVLSNPVCATIRQVLILTQPTGRTTLVILPAYFRGLCPHPCGVCTAISLRSSFIIGYASDLCNQIHLSEQQGEIFTKMKFRWENGKERIKGKNLKVKTCCLKFALCTDVC